LLAVGKPSPAKLGNFLEIDVFCLIACPENSLLDSREFMRPVVTPYELSLALDSEFKWNPSLYQFNLEQIDLQLKLQVVHLEEQDNDNNDSDQEPHFSLVTGGYAIQKQFSSRSKKEVGGQTVAKKWDGTVSQYTTVSAGAEFLKARIFQGLELDIGSDISKLEIGRKGIAKGYNNEI
jgi:diphthamide biosynthesis protein 2